MKKNKVEVKDLKARKNAKGGAATADTAVKGTLNRASAKAEPGINGVGSVPTAHEVPRPRRPRGFGFVT